MSGYDRQLGIFELTFSKANYYHRKPIDGQIKGDHFMGYVAELLKKDGYEVLKTTGNFLHVKATQAQIWEALSGEEAKPGHPVVYTDLSNIYGKKDHVQFISPTEIGKIMEPPISAIKVNKLLEKHKLQSKIGPSWRLTTKGEKYGIEKETTYTSKNNTTLYAIKWSKEVLDNIQQE